MAHPLGLEATLARHEEVRRLLGAVRDWGALRPDVRALGLVGSWARGTPRMDSDIDVLLLTDDVARYVERDDWIHGLAAEQVVRTTAWGPIVERRLRYPSGLELEVGIGRPDWAFVDPVDAGTRHVVREGLRILHDPSGLLAALQRGVSEAGT
jgi:predicted nucleotidyltransferase